VSTQRSRQCLGIAPLLLHLPNGNHSLMPHEKLPKLRMQSSKFADVQFWADLNSLAVCGVATMS